MRFESKGACDILHTIWQIYVLTVAKARFMEVPRSTDVVLRVKDGKTELHQLQDFLSLICSLLQLRLQESQLR